MRTSKMVRTRLVPGLILAAVGVVAAMQAHAATSPSSAQTVMNDVNSPRVSSISDGTSTAVVTGKASDIPGDATRTLWYETLAGAAAGQPSGAARLRRDVLDASGGVIDSETDSLWRGSNPFGQITLTESDIAASVTQGAKDESATVVDIHYIPLYGGTAEVVIQPDDPTGFVADASSKLSHVLGKLGQDSRPYLVTVVDKTGAPVLILGFTPGVGGDNGQGLGWVAPGMDSNTIAGPWVPAPSPTGGGA